MTEKIISECNKVDPELDALIKKAAKKNIKLLPEIVQEAFDRVWFDRSDVGTDVEEPGIPEEIRQEALAEQERIIQQYKINCADCDDFYHGYWSGILALSRFMTGEYGEDINELRYPCVILDT